MVQNFFLEIDKIDTVNEKYDSSFGVFSGFVKVEAKMAAALAPDILEKKGLEILWKEKNKQKLMAIVKNTLDIYDVYLSKYHNKTAIL